MKSAFSLAISSSETGLGGPFVAYHVGDDERAILAGPSAENVAGEPHRHNILTVDVDQELVIRVGVQQGLGGIAVAASLLAATAFVGAVFPAPL